MCCDHVTIASVFACQATGLERFGLRLWIDVDVRHAERQSSAGSHHLRPAVQYVRQITGQCSRRHCL